MRRPAATLCALLLSGAAAFAQETLEGVHQLALARVAWSPDGKLLVTSGEDNFIGVWDASTRKSIAKLEGHEKYVNGLAFLPEGTFVSADLSQVVIFWDLAAKKEKKRAELPAPCFNILLSPDGKRIYSGGREAKIVAWDLERAPAESPAWVHEGDVLGMALSPSGQHLVAATQWGAVVVWDTAKGEALHKIKHGEDKSAATAVAPDGKSFVTGGGDGSLRLWDLDKGSPRDSFACPGLDVRTLFYSKDGKTIVAGTSEGQLKFVDAASGKIRETVAVSESPIVSTALSPDGRKIAVASIDPIVRIVGMK